MEVKRLENICLDLLLKSCGLDYFIKKPIKIKISLYCLLDEFLTEICEKVFYFCKCPNREHTSEMVNYCDWGLFYKDVITFSTVFNKIRNCSSIIKIANIFDLFLG